MHIMIDFETYGTSPYAVPLSLGAVAFDSNGINENRFYANIDRQNCIDLGLLVDQQTVDWWAKQSKEAQQALIEEPVLPLFDVLSQFSKWVRDVNGLFLWGNGADFDNPILKSAYIAIDADMPFKPYNGRCYRTIKCIPGMPKLTKRTGVHHNALHDAISQAEHLIEMNKLIRVF